MTNTRKAETVAPYVLLGLTAVTGILDDVSFLALGRVFTANMTGNVAILAFAAARLPGLSVQRSLTTLAVFLAGAAFGGWLISKANEGSLLRFASRSFAVEIAFLSIAVGCAIGYPQERRTSQVRSDYESIQPADGCTPFVLAKQEFQSVIHTNGKTSQSIATHGKLVGTLRASTRRHSDYVSHTLGPETHANYRTASKLSASAGFRDLCDLARFDGSEDS